MYSQAYRVINWLTDQFKIDKDKDGEDGVNVLGPILSIYTLQDCDNFFCQQRKNLAEQYD